LLGREDDHSPPSSAEVNNAWSYTSTPSIRLRGVVVNEKVAVYVYIATLKMYTENSLKVFVAQR
jgi:hypothetical protein